MFEKKNQIKCKEKKYPKLTDKLRAGGDLPADDMKQEKQVEQFCKKGMLIKEMWTQTDKVESFRGGDKQGYICMWNI